ncbi:MAG: xylose isomerase [Flammeovirgaceae bacterium]|nr:xylose isomerase [Flammeovirgaceae bacterium]|tara:strand:+ start:923 stop:1855 length:933 start_codon:yes stop_codon:yes gene_type:complete
MKRRDFVIKSILAGSVVSNPIIAYHKQDPFFEIGLAQWSLNKSLKSGKIDNLDFARIAREKFDIGIVEYVNQFFINKAKDKKYLSEMLNISNDNGIVNNLIMIDSEGNLGDTNNRRRNKAINNHKKWIEAAKFLGCSHIRVNAAGDGSEQEVSKNASESLAALGEFSFDYDINVIVENHGGYSSNAKWLVEVIKNAGLKNVGTLPDFGNFCIRSTPKDLSDWGATTSGCAEEYDRYLGVEELLPYALSVSAKSNDFDSDGNCIETDFSRMVNIIKNSDYRGYISIEYEGSNYSEEEGIRLTKSLLEREAI